MARIYEKDPGSRLDYGYDYASWLAEAGGDTLVSKTVTVTAGDVVVDSSAIVGTQVVAWISGGTAGTQAKVTIRVTTAGGRIDERSINLVVIDK